MSGAILVTGGTGYLGSYVITELLSRDPQQRLVLLVRGKGRGDALEKLWRALQLHVDGKTFWEWTSRIDFALGDLTHVGPRLGMDEVTYAKVARSIESVAHIAASLNRKSEKACLNTNLRGTLGVIQLAREAVKARGGLRRFSHVSTVAVAGERSHETVTEDRAVDWNRSDYDPYARTKKFCEHMVRELLPDVPKTFFRPAIVMGDTRKPETTQFDMVRAFCVLADLPVVPVRPDARQDIVPADYVGRAVATIHTKEKPAFDCYHLSAGEASLTARQIATALVRERGGKPPVFVARGEKPFAVLAEAMMRAPKKSSVALVGSLLHVFLPYITYDTVFDNARVVAEMGARPASFDTYCAPLYAWAKARHFTYPYAPLPARPTAVAVPVEVRR